MEVTFPRAIGADGCKNGLWISVGRDSPNARLWHLVCCTRKLIENASKCSVICIDIPIGLSEEGDRDCDRAARKLLGRPRASSVFGTPPRPLLQAKNWEQVCRLKRFGKGISKQCFGILNRIREIDDALKVDASLCGKLFEVHPEICFWAMADHHPMKHSKKRKAGREEREKLIVGHFGLETFQEVRSHYMKKEVSNDDLLDAFAALWTAERIAAGSAKQLPQAGLIQRDSCGMPMAIWY